MRDVVIVAAARTPVGAFGGMFSNTPASTLGSLVIKNLLERTGIKPKEIDEVIFGNVLTAGLGMNPARQASIGAGLPYEMPSFTINKVCGSGLKAIQLAAQAIECNRAEIIIAGGQESMSMAPHLLPDSRIGKRMGDWTLIDSMIYDGLLDIFNDYHMGVTAENIAEQYGISREEQDEFSLESQRRTKKAMDDGKFDKEIVTIEVKKKKGEILLCNKDEYPKPNTTSEKLAALKPAFKEGGTVTAGNSTGINDGAAAVIVMSASKAKELGLEPMARIVTYASAGVDPKLMGIGPIPATKKCLKQATWTVEDLDLVELNESFAVQCIAACRDLKLDKAKLNVNGGSISIGHPIGASGARILVTLLHAMIDRHAKKGLAALCIGGGMGTAIAIER
jgi:acetyl-CoA C-acetyltransferase